MGEIIHTLPRYSAAEYLAGLKSGAVCPHAAEYLRRDIPRNIDDRVWKNEGKQERYAFFEFMVDSIIGRMLDSRDNRPPFGLVDNGVRGKKTTEGKFTTLQSHMCATFLIDMDLELNRLKKVVKEEPDSEDGRLFAGYQDWVRMRQALFFPGTPDLSISEQDAKKELFNAFQHGTGEMSELLYLVPQVVKRDVQVVGEDVSLYSSIARGSHRLVTEPAKMLIVEFLSGIQQIRDGQRSFSLNPDFLEIQQGEDGDLSMDFTEQGYNALNNTHPGVFLDLHHKRVGCPALQSLKKLWDWHVDIAETMYADDIQQAKHL